jgi:putative chitinase
MHSINRAKFLKGFFDLHRERVKPITAEVVQRMEPPTIELLDMMERDAQLVDIRHAAYILATVYHETAATMKPLAEYGKGRGRLYGRPVAYTISGVRYVNVFYGRGYVQLTWFNNYLKAARRLGNMRIVTHPDSVKEAQTAYDILSIGMREGMFTGKKLSDYIASGRRDYRNARRIVNGLDKADLIAGYARRFESILKLSAQ